MTWRLTTEEVLSSVGVKTSYQKMFQRQEDQYEDSWSFPFAETSTIGSGAWTTIYSKPMVFPEYFKDGDQLVLKVRAVGGSADPNHHRLRLNIDSTNFAETNIEEGASYGIVTVTATFAADPSAKVLAVNLQGYDNAGAGTNLQAKGTELGLNMWAVAG